MFSVLPRLPWRQAQRLSGNGSSVSALRRCSGTTNGSDDADKKGLTTTIPDEEEDDEFAMEGFQVEEEKEEDIESALAKLSKQEEDESTPQLASDLVARMVEATTRKLDNRVSIQAVLPAITSHTVSVLRASRISINTIQATGSSILGYPIENKVTAEVNISQLNLSTPARTALEILAGPRLKGDYVKIACNQYPTREENRVYIVSQIDRLVSAAKESVGDPVEQTPLETWHNVVEEVQKQASGEITEAGGVSLLLGETKVEHPNDTGVVEDSQDLSTNTTRKLCTAAKHIAGSLTSVIMSSHNEDMRITCLQSVSAQDGDELLRVLERCVLACLMEQTRQNHSRDQLDTQCDHSAACEQSPNDKNAVGEAL